MQPQYFTGARAGVGVGVSGGYTPYQQIKNTVYSNVSGDLTFIRNRSHDSSQSDNRGASSSGSIGRYQNRSAPYPPQYNAGPAFPMLPPANYPHRYNYLCHIGWVYVFYVGHVDRIDYMKPSSIL
jgi:hypothetical protein